MKPAAIKLGETIGIISPCHYAEKERYKQFIKGVNALGFEVKEGSNLYKNTYGYAASESERLEDFMQMVIDPKVKMILFGGGNVGNELITQIDYDVVKRHPKIICSYSNGTTLLNTIFMQTGMQTYYGQFPGIFADLSDYDKLQFFQYFVENTGDAFIKNSEWNSLFSGDAEGILIGGYTTCFAMMQNHPYFSYNKNEEYILFLENNEQFNSPGMIAAHLAHIEQSGFAKRVKGLLFGNYAQQENLELLDVLKRFGERNNISVMKCDDFGHGESHGVLTIGRRVLLSTDYKELRYL